MTGPDGTPPRGPDPATPDWAAGPPGLRLARLADLALGVDGPTSAEWVWLSRPENRAAADFVRRFRVAFREYRRRVVAWVGLTWAGLPRRSSGGGRG